MSELLFLLAVLVAPDINEAEFGYQRAVFYQWWHSEFVWKFADLPTTARVPTDRVPYSGYIYPDYKGGTTLALQQYDHAFHDAEMLATSHEQRDITTAGAGPSQPRLPQHALPHWHGHCNGWAAAAIRHAEPQLSVERNGVVFTPQVIKALLAEIYVYNDPQMLAGDNAPISAGLLHVLITNWVGRGLHPIAMESDLGPEKWNYPIYAFSTSSRMLTTDRVEVKMLIAFSDSTPREIVRSRVERIMRFHYSLELNESREIVGGQYYPDSSRIQSLWVPLRPKPAGTPGNERGNSHVDVDTVLSIWRESVLSEQLNRAIIDPVQDQRAHDAGNDSEQARR